MKTMRGRPGKVDPEKMKEAVVKYKYVINNNNTIVSKNNEIWKTIARELGSNVTSKSVYVFVMCNRYNVKNEIINQVSSNDIVFNESALCDTSESETCTSNSSNHRIASVNILLSLF